LFDQFGSAGRTRWGLPPGALPWGAPGPCRWLHRHRAEGAERVNPNQW